LFIFACEGPHGEQAEVRVRSVDWSLSGSVEFRCDDDAFACLLLSGCRSDSGGFFNLLAGCKPLYVEQWLNYLQEQGRIDRLSLKIHQVGDADYAQQLGLNGGEREELLALIYQIGGFNRLQIARYLKQRNNPAVLATKYSQSELERYRLLNEVIRLLMRLKASSP
jgi:hypothetical protein